VSEAYHSLDTVKRRFKPRIYSIITVIGISILFYIAFLYHLQIVKGSEYQNRARAVSRRVTPIPAQRGEIFDRNHDAPLVSNIDSFAVNIIPGDLSDRELDEVAGKLSGVLAVSKESIIKKIPQAYRSLYQAVEIKSGVPFHTISHIAERIDEFPGVTWQSKPIRNYRDVDSMIHFLGYVGNISREELQVMYNRGYNINSVLGKTGVERQYDDILRGSPGKRYKVVDVQGRQVQERQYVEEPPINGNDLVLTIDRNIQKLTEEALGERMGSAVVLDASTGEILAMVSYPWFDANRFYQAEAERYYRQYALDPKHPFINRSIQASYSPASTFKVVMTTAALEEEAIDPEREINCTGRLRVGNRYFNCHVEEGHGPVDLTSGLAESCNVYFYNLGLNHLGIEAIARYARSYGFGEFTGIDIPGEVRGLVPTPEWKAATYNSPWVGGDTVNVSIGQGALSVTPMQMANMIAMIANEGHVYRPHLLKQVVDPSNAQVIEEVEPEVLRTSSIRSEVFREVQDKMRYVITDGTAEVVITTEAVKVAGKTGTGEVGLENSWTAWFAAYGPYDAPIEDRIVVVTMVEAGNDWEWWAVRAANIIFQGIFADQNYDEAIEALNWGWLHNDRH